MPGNSMQDIKRGLYAAVIKGKIDVNTMVGILRDEKSSINFVGELVTVGSQVSVISPSNSSQPLCHWFTATPNAKYSVFKSFIFCDNITFGNYTVSSTSVGTPRSTFQPSIDRIHPLYKAHEKGREIMNTESPAGKNLQTTMQNSEKKQCLKEVTEFFRAIFE